MLCCCYSWISPSVLYYSILLLCNSPRETANELLFPFMFLVAQVSHSISNFTRIFASSRQQYMCWSEKKNMSNIFVFLWIHQASILTCGIVSKYTESKALQEVEAYSYSFVSLCNNESLKWCGFTHVFNCSHQTTTASWFTK